MFPGCCFRMTRESLWKVRCFGNQCTAAPIISHEKWLTAVLNRKRATAHALCYVSPYVTVL